MFCHPFALCTNKLCRAESIANVEFVEGVPFRRMDEYFRRAKVFANTSDAEGFPNTFIQAAQWSVPILSLFVNPDGFLTEYTCGVECSGQMSRLAEGLQFMLENERFAEFGENAYRYVQERHDITYVVERYKQLFRELAGRQR